MAFPAIFLFVSVLSCLDFVSASPAAQTFHLADQHETVKTARQIADVVAQRKPSALLITLTGDLGSGKTTLCRAIIQHWLGQNTEVTSPTFALIHSILPPHDRSWPQRLHHIDLYRLNDSDSLKHLGLDDILTGILLVEWPERLLLSGIVEPSTPMIHLNLTFLADASDAPLAITDNGQRQLTVRMPHTLWNDELVHLRSEPSHARDR